MTGCYKGHVKLNYGPNKHGPKKAGKVLRRRYVRHKTKNKEAE